MLRVAYSFPLRFGLPGVGTTAWHQVQGLVAQGVAVTLFCGTCERPVLGVQRVVESLKVAGLRLPIRVLGQQRSLVYHDWVVQRELLRMRQKVDVVHCWPGGALNTLAAAKRLGIPSFLERPNCHTAFAFEIVAMEHEKIGLPIPRNYSHALDSRRLRQEEAEYAAADTLLCPSEFVARTFRDRGFPDDRLLRHQYGYDPNRFKNSTEPHLERPFTAAFVGRCEPRKGLHYALQAWHESGAARHGRFLICGSFMDGYRELLKPWLDHPSVEILGFVSNVQDVMHQADVLVLPAVEEGSALVTYEARGAGCVLVVSTATGAICEPNRDALVHEPGDVAQLAQHLAALANDRDLLKDMREASIRNLDTLTWSYGATRLKACYASAHRPVVSQPAH